MSSDVEIRNARVGDVPAIAQLLDALNLVEGYGKITQTAEISQALFGENRAVQLAAFVAECGGVVIATLLFYPGYDTLSASYGYHLADMVVAGEHRQSGVGKLLVRALAQRALEENKEWVSLTVLKNNSDAIAFYRALGMTQVDVDFFAIGKTALSQL